MDKRQIIKWSLITFLCLSALFDLYSTLLNKNFLSLEANPIFVLFTSSVLPIIGIKLLLCFLVSRYFLKSVENKRRYIGIFWISFILVISVVQVFAGVNNLSIHEKVTNDVNTRFNTSYTASEIPKEVIESTYKVEERVAVLQYFYLVFIAIYYPLIISLSSYFIHEVLFNEKKE